MGSFTREPHDFPKLEDYNISPTLGFLASTPPLRQLPGYFKAWDDLAPRLAELIKRKELRSTVDDLPMLDAGKLLTRGELQRAFVVLAFLVNGYVWQDAVGVTGDGIGMRTEANVPKTIGEPFLRVCGRLGMKETLSYAGLCLWNWVRVEGGGGEGLGNLDGLDCYLNFTGTRDEAVFYLVPVMMEAEGGKLVGLLLGAMGAAVGGRGSEEVVAALKETTETVKRMGGMMKLLHEQCDTKVLYHQIRPYLAGGKGMEAKGLPDGVVFHMENGETVALKNVGGSAVQSSLFPFLDLALGIEHKPMPGAKGETMFGEMRAYMPSEHRRFLEEVAKLPSLKQFVQSKGDDQSLVEAYNGCLQQLASWRSKHIGVVTTHIVNPARKSMAATAGAGTPGDEEVEQELSVKNESGLQGTGGSALIPFLKQAKMETLEACT